MHINAIGSSLSVLSLSLSCFFFVFVFFLCVCACLPFSSLANARFCLVCCSSRSQSAKTFKHSPI
jgi:hypothetical protein